MIKGFLRSIAALAAGALVVACGGGDTVVPFEPTRMVAFGDELSVIEDDGRKYTVNAMTSGDTPVVDCKTHPLWIQIVAQGFGMVFAQCNPDGVESTRAEIRATPGAKVADLRVQVDDFLASGTPRDTDLVTMLVGVHDVLELYGRSPAESNDSLIELAKQRGRELADEVNRVALAGPAVVVSTTLDVGLTPLAVAAGTDAQRFLTRLSDGFNEGLRVNMVQDGRLVGIVFGDAMVRAGASGALPGIRDDVAAPVTTALCLPEFPLPNCDNFSGQLVENGTAGGWLWADATRPAPTVHFYLGQQALGRARSNPF